MLEPYKGRVYRPLLRLRRDVRAVGEVRRGARRAAGRHLDLRAGVEPDDLAAVQDEPGHPGHRGQPRAARRPTRFHQRPAQGPEGRLHPGQSAVQHERLGRRPAARGRPLAVRRAAGRQRQLSPGCSTSSTTWRRGGMAGVRAGQRLDVVATQSGEGEIRRAIVEADLVDCMVALPGQLFYTTQIPACLWFLARNKAERPFRDRRGETLFIDARKLGAAGGPHPPRIDRRGDRPHRADVPRLAGRGRRRDYADVAGLLQERHARKRSPGTATC